MNILSTIARTPANAVNLKPQADQSQPTQPAPPSQPAPQPHDTFMQNVGQFLEGATPILGGRVIFDKDLGEKYSANAGAAIVMGQAAGCYFGLLAGMMHAAQGLQAAAFGYGIAAIGLVASGIGHASAPATQS